MRVLYGISDAFAKAFSIGYVTPGRKQQPRRSTFKDRVRLEHRMTLLLAVCGVAAICGILQLCLSR